MSWGDTQIDTPPTASTSRRAFRPIVQVAFLYVGIVLPVICFGLTPFGPVDPPDWQSGDVHDYVNYLLSGRTGYVFFPLLLYSMVSFCIAVLDIRKYADTMAVQFGVYSGVVLALHYSVVLYIVTFQVAAVGVAMLGFPVVVALALLATLPAWGIMLAVGEIFRQLGGVTSRRGGIVAVAAVLLLVLLFAIGVVADDGILMGIVTVPFALFIGGSLFASAYWTLGAYTFVAIKLARRNWASLQFRLSQLLFAFTWLAVYLAACRAAVLIALTEYAKLPTSPSSDCYIATAAARGHRRFVGARAISLGAGRVLWLNRQLVVLKCGELAIRALCPRVHRVLRCVYDRFGPQLAAGISHRLLADVAFLALKPCEWFASVVLVLLLPRDQWHLVSEIYMNAQSGKNSTPPP